MPASSLIHTLIVNSVNTNALISRLVPIVYEDRRLLAVVKPAGIDVGVSSRSSGLVELLQGFRPDGESLMPCNRLNRFESGVLMLAKDPLMAAHVRTGLKTGRITQEYVAVVRASMSQPVRTIDASHGTSRGRDKKRSGRRSKKNGARTVTSSQTGATVSTTVTRLKRGPRWTLVQCRTNAANTHILRAQLRSARMRLLGDQLSDLSRRSVGEDATCLHLVKVSLHHPDLKRKITIRSKAPPGFESVIDGGWDVERHLHAALTRRLPCVLDSGGDAYRLLTGQAEGVKGLAAERYGDVVVLQIAADREDWIELARAAAKWYHRMLGVKAVYVKRFVRHRGSMTDEIEAQLHNPKPLVGETVPSEIQVRERGLRFAIRPYQGFSVGLFLDQRENRTRVREFAEGKDVLNLFAYTCGFSVAAAAGGARSTVSVDIAANHLDWGRTNFGLNRLELDGHIFIRSDAADYLKRAKRQSKKFDLIILDAPSFAHGRKSGQRFSILDGLADLVARCVEVLAARGTMLISTNHRRLSLGGLKDRLAEGAGNRRFRIVATPPLPVDFVMDRDHAKTIEVRFD